MQATRNQIIKEEQLWSQLTKVLPYVVAKYVSRKAIPFREKEEVELSVIEKLLLKKEQILSSFRGDSSFKTYSIAVVNRMVCEVIRKESKHWYAVDQEFNLQREDAGEEWETEKELYIKSEVKRYRMALKLFDNNGEKESLFFKYYFGLSLSLADIEKYATIKYQLAKEILDVNTASKAEKFEKLAQVVNEIENKSVKSDAIRMWLNKQLDHLILRLNANGNSNHTKETLAILLEVAQIRNY